MSFKLSIPLRAAVYGFLYSFAQSSLLQEEYVNQVLSVGLNEQVNPICNVSPPKWAGICTYYIGEIRKHYEMYHEMRINYMAFSINEEKCQKKMLQFMYPLPNGIFYAEQNMMLCFGREAIVPVDKSYEKYKYYIEIAIYPKDENMMMVFQYSSVYQNFILFEKYEGAYWPAIPDIPDLSLLITPPPHVISEENDVYNRLHEIVHLLENTSNDKSNVIYTIKKKEYEQLLIMLVKYSCFANIATPVLLKETHKKYVYFAETIPANGILRTSEPSSVRETNLSTISCVLQSTIKEGTKIYSMRLSAGPEKHSVLLLRRTRYNNKNCYRIMNIFENLHPEFISYYL